MAVTAYYGKAPVGLPQLRVVTGPCLLFLAKLAGRAIYFTLRNFFLFFLFFIYGMGLLGTQVISKYSKCFSEVFARERHYGAELAIG